MVEITRFDVSKGRQLLEWIISLDDPDPESGGFQDRRTVTLTQIISKAQECFTADRGYDESHIALAQQSTEGIKDGY